MLLSPLGQLAPDLLNRLLELVGGKHLSLCPDEAVFQIQYTCGQVVYSRSLGLDEFAQSLQLRTVTTAFLIQPRQHLGLCCCLHG